MSSRKSQYPVSKQRAFTRNDPTVHAYGSLSVSHDTNHETEPLKRTHGRSLHSLTNQRESIVHFQQLGTAYFKTPTSSRALGTSTSSTPKKSITPCSTRLSTSRWTLQLLNRTSTRTQPCAYSGVILIAIFLCRQCRHLAS